MRVLFVTTTYPSDENDWKGRFMLDMLLSLSRLNDVDLYYWGPPGPIPGTVINICTANESRWLDKMLSQGGIATIIRKKTLQSIFTAARLMLYLWRAYRRRDNIDLIHINWLQNCIPSIFINKPKLITSLGSDMKLINNTLVRRAFLASINSHQTIIAPNAAWMVEPLKRLFPNNIQICTVPFGVNQQWLDMKRSYDPDSIHKWLIVLRITRSKIGNLFEWTQPLQHSNNEFHLFGPMQEDIPIPDWIHYHGPTDPKQLLHDWFPTSSGLITLSQHDEGMPQIILDAMASSLPVIASDIDAHKNIITHGKSGYIVSGQTEFDSALAALSTSKQNMCIGDNARKWVCENIGNWDNCASRYQKQYMDLTTGP